MKSDVPAEGSGAATAAKPARAWQRMLSGRRLNLLDPSPMDIEIEDIAQGLSRVARWNGQTHGDWAFSVAQHTVLVETLAGRIKPDAYKEWRLAALLHDAPEYVVGDLITPFKAAVGLDYKTLEQRLLSAVFIRFGLPGTPPSALARLIKRADSLAAFLEATQLAGFTESEARRYFTKPRRFNELAGDLILDPLPPQEAKAHFLDRFHVLAPQVPPSHG